MSQEKPADRPPLKAERVEAQWNFNAHAIDLVMATKDGQLMQAQLTLTEVTRLFGHFVVRDF